MPAWTTFFIAMMLASSAWCQTLEDTAHEIEGKLMAPCCWASPVSQHYSQTADEIRRGIREMLAAGKSEKDILDFYVSVYGERVLASPPARGFNLLAWALPGIFFVAGIVFLCFLLRRWTRRKPTSVEADLPAAQLDERYRARLDQELRDFE